MWKQTTHAEQVSALECSQRLGVHRSTVSRWVRRGLIPAWRIGGIVRINWIDVLELICRQNSGREEL